MPLSAQLREALGSLRRAEINLRHLCTPEREAVHREIIQAAVCVGRGLHLLGEDARP